MLEWLGEPLSHAFILRGLAGGLLSALTCALLSSFVVWRGWAFIGDAVAHAILPGIVIAYALGFSLIIGALAAAALAVLGIALISSKSRLREDSAIGIVFAGFFALGLLFLTRVASNQDLNHILFGNILGISKMDIIAMSIITLLILVIVSVSFKELLTASFDPAHAAAIGLSPGFIRYLLLLLLAFTTVIAVQTVGVVLVIALLVTPAASASLLTKKLASVIALSLLFACTATITGFYVSYYADLASGPTIVLVLIGFFVISLTIASFRQQIPWKP